MRKLTRRERRRPESRCPNCENSIFDDTWGDYKCKVKKRRVRNPEDYTGCKEYRKKT